MPLSTASNSGYKQYCFIHLFRSLCLCVNDSSYWLRTVRLQFQPFLKKIACHPSCWWQHVTYNILNAVHGQMPCWNLEGWILQWPDIRGRGSVFALQNLSRGWIYLGQLLWGPSRQYTVPPLQIKVWCRFIHFSKVQWSRNKRPAVRSLYDRMFSWVVSFGKVQWHNTDKQYYLPEMFADMSAGHVPESDLLRVVHVRHCPVCSMPISMPRLTFLSVILLMAHLQARLYIHRQQSCIYTWWNRTPFLRKKVMHAPYRTLTWSQDRLWQTGASKQYKVHVTYGQLFYVHFKYRNSLYHF